ncbi:transposase, family IS1341 [Gloeothece citriformis PCC 7424]|uniref:Transposase, family IS1341 n=1 Tax=Gloeothece citriformis (strain PCC 7424) TaxID=65393 RepID=B7KJM4_GLOC7|nr:RNA-guided endonuclease TnpB family protein [Gloeothece citriformis]ACK73701.1 transposase, family IS1341 [Gloeothece citriformis PCC 7424]
MFQNLSIKLKLNLNQEQKESLRQVSLAYRDALNYTSQIAFENGKSSNGTKLQKLVYYKIRERFKLPAQMACNVPRQVSASYKGLWTKFRQNKQAREKGITKKRYKGLDKTPKFASRTCTLNYLRDYSFKNGHKVSIVTLSGRIVVSYSGYNKHIDWIKDKGKIGAAKIFYNRTNKTYYLLVSVEIELPDINPENVSRVYGIDVGQRYLAVKAGIDDSAEFFSGKEIRHKANRYHRARKTLQRKGTRSAKRRLVALSGRERRFIAGINHQISKHIAQPNSLIGLEQLAHIRERTQSKSGKRASKRQRKAKRNKAKWSFAELHSCIDYKAIMNGSLAIKVMANYTSQCCPKCGHVSKENRPNKGLNFVCQSCDYQLHADLVGGRNIALRALLIRQDWISTGILSASPNVSDDEAKAKSLQRFLELRWSPDASPDLSFLRVGVVD